VRVFVALRLPAEVADDADRALAPVRAAHPELRWVPPVRWHLTLAFHGEVADDKVPALADKLGRRVRRHGPLELALRGSGHFARRALWLGVAGDVDPLGALARDVTADGSPFRAHLTVARLRGGVDPAPARAGLAGYAGPSWTADQVCLVRSRLGPAPTYDDVAVWPLEARP
jgi:2'-5' RNA ligase